VFFSNATSHCWNWGSLAEERRQGRCGNGDKVRGDGGGDGGRRTGKGTDSAGTGTKSVRLQVSIMIKG
jgi:hypothetical protein